ncbi:unnamed protein product [Cladocopium goreaui]|uniref:RNA exonuclease 4 n=1 Tax=Cladocopium goreaui TaxID=2562237 RepID=A0A9P1DL76_9DINO|nr:unnamed protein product [Cladocopium goreaui]
MAATMPKCAAEATPKDDPVNVLPQHRRPRVRALDCEMVGVGFRGKRSVLIRVSVVSRHGKVLLDCLTEPEEEVTDWRTAYTGVDAEIFREIQQGSTRYEPQLPTLVLPTPLARAKVNALLDQVVVVGHDLRHDFHLLQRGKGSVFPQPRHMTRDTAFSPLLKAGLERPPLGLPGLKTLAASWLGDASLHCGAHSSVEDARVAMLLYRLLAPQWEIYDLRRYGAPDWTAFGRFGRRAKVKVRGKGGMAWNRRM